ncbi:hypothetical protein NOR53_2294 [gamma proteobacterium NOR5-3]|nr:hypothetical protein NOR53_2294 [gamma proteobacterium NOR5-3]
MISHANSQQLPLRALLPEVRFGSLQNCEVSGGFIILVVKLFVGFELSERKGWERVVLIRVFSLYVM